LIAEGGLGVSKEADASILGAGLGECWKREKENASCLRQKGAMPGTKEDYRSCSRPRGSCPTPFFGLPKEKAVKPRYRGGPEKGVGGASSCRRAENKTQNVSYESQIQN